MICPQHITTDDYLQFIDDTATKLSSHQHFTTSAYSYLDRILRSSTTALDPYIDFRSNCLTNQEISHTDGLCTSSCFQYVQPHLRRLGAIQLCIDLERTLQKQRLIQRISPYNIQHPIFVKTTNYADCVRKNELIYASSIEYHAADLDVCKFNLIYAHFDCLLGHSLIRTLFSNYLNNPLYLRLIPFLCSTNKPPSITTEEVLRPANPTWAQKLTLFNNQRDGGHYVLHDLARKINSPEDSAQVWEYRVKRIISLETSFKRDNSGRLTCMVEELSNELSDSNIMLGRCVHFDTLDPVGTDIQGSSLSHFDYAINVYIGEAIRIRSAQRLCDGKVVDASHRTHLFRIENVPFRFLFETANLIFKSSHLTREWLSDQFRLT